MTDLRSLNYRQVLSKLVDAAPFTEAPGLKGLLLTRISVQEGPKEEEMAACCSIHFRDFKLLNCSGFDASEAACLKKIAVSHFSVTHARGEE